MAVLGDSTGVVLAGPISQVIAACGTDEVTVGITTDKKLTGTVNVLAWGDKLNDTVNSRFAERTGGKAVFTIFTENPEAFAKVKSNVNAFDTMFIDGLWANANFNAGHTVPIPFKDMKSYSDYFPNFRDLPIWQVDGGVLAIPHAWSADGLAYNKKYVTLPENPSLDILFDPKYEGKVAIYDSFYRNILNFVPAITSMKVQDMHVKTADGEEAYDIPDDVLKTVKEQMIKSRKNFKMIWKDIDELTRALVSEEIWIAIAGNYITQNALDAGSTDIEFVNPTAHGLMGWIDGQSMIKNEQYEKNPDLVLAWLDYYALAEQQVDIIGTTWLASTNERALRLLEEKDPANIQRVAKLQARNVDVVDSMSLLRPIADPAKFQDAWAEFLASG